MRVDGRGDGVERMRMELKSGERMREETERVERMRV